MSAAIATGSLQLADAKGSQFRLQHQRWASTPNLGWAGTTFSGAIAFGALVGYVIAAIAGPVPQHRHSSAVNRIQPTGRDWIVLAHDLPRERQAEVAKLLRKPSQNWCTVALTLRRLYWAVREGQTAEKGRAHPI